MNISLPIGFALLLIAFAVTTFIYPLILKFALDHQIVDNPNARKLQRVPVPVMGGATVVIGVIVAFMAGYLIFHNSMSLIVVAILLVMSGIGIWDDIKDISAIFRFLVEIVVVWCMILFLDVEINDFHGLWGIHEIPDMVSVPLSIFAGVGMINAVNLIDGVDGYCSSYGMLTCASFAIIFFLGDERMYFNLAVIFIGAVLPFFLHNVFGRTSKMFLGDGGSLALGTLLALFVFATLDKDSGCAKLAESGISLIALTLAIMAVPVFDTLRVMTARILKGKSPFHPDKTHLHHLFIDMEFSHLSTSFVIVFSNLLIILVNLLVWKLGFSQEVQVYTVIVCSVLYTTVFYYYMRRQIDNESPMYLRACRVGMNTHKTDTGLWHFLRVLVDSPLLGGLPAQTVSENEAAAAERHRVKIDPRIRE